MELKDFIKQTLLDITMGVDEANKIANRFELSSDMHNRTGESGQRVEFDVTVVANESTGSGVKGGINVVGLGIGGTTTESDSNEHTQKIKFQVFISESVK